MCRWRPVFVGPTFGLSVIPLTVRSGAGSANSEGLRKDGLVIVRSPMAVARSSPARCCFFGPHFHSPSSPRLFCFFVTRAGTPRTDNERATRTAGRANEAARSGVRRMDRRLRPQARSAMPLQPRCEAACALAVREPIGDPRAAPMPPQTRSHRTLADYEVGRDATEILKAPPMQNHGDALRNLTKQASAQRARPSQTRSDRDDSNPGAVVLLAARVDRTYALWNQIFFSSFPSAPAGRGGAVNRAV